VINLRSYECISYYCIQNSKCAVSFQGINWIALQFFCDDSNLHNAHICIHVTSLHTGLQVRLSEFFYPLLGCARFWGRCWEAIRLCHRPKPLGHAVHGQVDGLDIGGRHGQRFVLLRHTHRPQRGLYPICTSRSENVRHKCGGG